VTSDLKFDGSITFDEYATEARRTAGPDLGDTDRMILAALGVAGESGEFVDLVKKHVYHGHQLNFDKYISELGDILWYVALGARALGIPLAQIAEYNVVKLRKRYPDGFTSERSINRGED
jgi:NTP pyrophosphatase (non-canonical NTP hydrolase)